MGEVDPEDRKVVSWQIGRDPRGLVEISSRCSYDYPVVITTKPLILRGGEEFDIFPTLYWLTCPRRVEAIARAESEGYIEELEAELRADSEFYRKYRRDERRYLEKQRELLTKEELEFLRGKGLLGAISRGIGGIESDRHLKCLHLHVAGDIADRNVVGARVRKEFGPGDCPGAEIRCQDFSPPD